MRGLNQRKLADAIHVEPPTVSRWVNAQDFPSDKYLNDICEALEVEMSFFGFDGLSAGQMIDFLQENKQLLTQIVRIPTEVLELLGKQDQTYFNSLKRTLEVMEIKKKEAKKAKKQTI